MNIKRIVILMMISMFVLNVVNARQVSIQPYSMWRKKVKIDNGRFVLRIDVKSKKEIMADEYCVEIKYDGKKEYIILKRSFAIVQAQFFSKSKEIVLVSILPTGKPEFVKISTSTWKVANVDKGLVKEVAVVKSNQEDFKVPAYAYESFVVLSPINLNGMLVGCFQESKLRVYFYSLDNVGSKDVLSYLCRQLQPNLQRYLKRDYQKMFSYRDSELYWRDATGGKIALVLTVERVCRGEILKYSDVLKKDKVEIEVSSSGGTEVQYPIREYLELFKNKWQK